MLTNKIYHSDWSINRKFRKFKELLQNFGELIRGTAKLEEMNCSNIFGTLLLPRL